PWSASFLTSTEVVLLGRCRSSARAVSEIASPGGTWGRRRRACWDRPGSPGRRSAPRTRRYAASNRSASMLVRVLVGSAWLPYLRCHALHCTNAPQGGRLGGCGGRLARCAVAGGDDRRGGRRRTLVGLLCSARPVPRREGGWEGLAGGA